MEIKFVEGDSIDLSWCDDTCYIGQLAGGEYQQVELPCHHIQDLIKALQKIAQEHIAANGEPPAGW